MDLRCAGALLALAACIASTAAAPTASNQTALDVYDGAPQGCYYNFQHYGEGDRIMTNEPCLNCTCHNRMLMCYLRVCPFTKPIGQDCSVEKRADQCCPIVTCPDVPVDLLTSTSTTSPAEYGETGVGKLDKYGCSINGKYFSEGSKVPPSPNKPCEHCYCIRNMTTCVMQECTLHVDGCTPIYRKDVCCPVRYSCDHPEDTIPLLDDMTTTVRPTPGFLLTTTTTTLSPVTQMTQDCVHDDKIFADGALIKTEKACEHCYCMKGDIVCVVQECGTPMENEGKNCTSIPPREGQCCPDTYICEGDELTTETSPDLATVTPHEDITTLTPPRRVSVEGSGYRNEPDEPLTEVPTFEPDTEGSGEEQEPFKPMDTEDMLIPERETSRPYTTTKEEENVSFTPSTPKTLVTDIDMTEKATTEPDKGENTVPSGSMDENISEVSIRDETTPHIDKMSPESVSTTESYFDAPTVAQKEESSIKDTTDTEGDVKATQVPSVETTVTKATIADKKSPSLDESTSTIEDESTAITEPTRRAQEDEKTPSESSTQRDDGENVTTKSSDYTITTESSTIYVKQEAKATTSPLPEHENEVLIQETSTESNVALSTQSGVIKTETESAIIVQPEIATTVQPEIATTVQPEIATEPSTHSKDHELESTSINPVDNEIDEESYPTPSAGRIPGEGDCLLDGVTYTNESIVPSTNNCHTSCRCISSIVKCDPIICSAPPDYMDNCQPMYDPPEACCPTYVCDHTKETVPPQPHSQMSGTESPVPTPTIECNGDQCEVSKDTEDSVKPTGSCTSEACSDDSSQKPVECGTDGCHESSKKPDNESAGECTGEKCTLPQELCTDGKCETPITKDQVCDNENGCDGSDKKPDQESAGDCTGEKCALPQEPCTDGKCETPITKDQACDSEHGCHGSDKKSDQESAGECTGENCALPQEPCTDGKCESPITKDQACDSEHGCHGSDKKSDQESAGECTGEKCALPQEPCTDGKCESPITKDQVCDSENGCKLPTDEPCQGEQCKIQPETTPGKDSAIACSNADDCKDNRVADRVPDCEGESCVSGITSKTEEKEGCKDGSDCAQTDQIPSIEECNEEECRKQQIPHISKPVTGECTGTECVTQDNVPITSAPAFDQETVPSATELPISYETKPEESTTILPKTTNIDKEVQSSETTEATNLYKDEESKSTPHYDEDEHQKEQATQPSITEVPEIQSQPTEPQSLDVLTSTASPKETTVIPSKDISKEQDILTDVTPTDSGETSTNVPKLDEGVTIAGIAKTEIPESVTVPQAPITYQEDTTEFEKEHDVTTGTPSSPISQDMDIDITKETTEPHKIPTPAPEHVDTTVKDSEYEKDDNVVLPSTIGPLQKTELPEVSHKDSEGKITESTVVYTNAPEQVSTEKIEQQPENAFTTPKSYEFETRVPEILGTSTQNIPEDKIEFTTAAPVEHVTISQIDEQKESELPISTISQEPSSINDISPTTEGTISPDVKVESVSDVTSKPEVSLDVSDSTQTSGLPDFTDKESYTKAPLSDVTDISDIHTEAPVTQSQELTTKLPEAAETEMQEIEDTAVTSSPDITDIQKVQTEAPKSSVKGDEKDEASPTQTTETDVSTSEGDLNTKKPESQMPEVSPTTVISTSESEQRPSEKPNAIDTDEKGIEKMPSLSDEEHVDIITEKTESDFGTTVLPHGSDESSSKQPVQEVASTNVPALITDETPVTVSIVGERDSSEPSEPTVTEANVHKTEPPLEEATEFVPVTSLSHDVIGTKSPESFTEHPTLDVSDKLDSTTSQDITEIPELTVHEHGDSSFATKQPERAGTEESSTKTIDMYVTDIPVIISEKDGIEAPEPQDTVTKSTESPVTEVQKEDEEKEYATKTPSIDVQEVSTNIPDTSPTESQKEATQTPDTHDSSTNVPEIGAESEKETPASPELHDISTSIPKIFVTELPMEVHKEPELQDSVTKTPDYVTTETVEEVTNVPEVQDISTSLPEMSEEPQFTKVSEPEPQEEVTKTPTVPEIATNAAEIPVTESQPSISQVPETQETGTKIPESSITESQKEATESPQVQDIITKVPEILVTESQKEVSEVHDTTTNVPSISVTAPQEIVSMSPESQSVGTDIPEIFETQPPKEATDASVGQDIATNILEISTTESQKEMTEGPMVQDTTTKVTEVSATELQKGVTETPGLDETITDIPKMPVTESEKELTESPEKETSTPDMSLTETQKGVSGESTTNIPGASESEPHTETTEAPESQDTNVPDTSKSDSETEVAPEPVTPKTDSKTPEALVTETQKEVTEAPGVHVDATDIPETPKIDAQKEVTDAIETADISTRVPEIVVTEPQKEVTGAPSTPQVTTNIPEVSVTELQMEVTEAPEKSETETQKMTEISETQDTFTKIPETSTLEPLKEVTEIIGTSDITTSIPDMLATEPHKVVTEQEVQELVTKQPERIHTEAIDFETKVDEAMVTGIGESITEPSPKVTAKLEEQTENEQPEIITQTESSKIGYDSTQPTEVDSTNVQSTKVPESLVTESDKITGSSDVTDKPKDITDDQDKPKDDEKEITQIPITEPSKLSEHTEPEKSGVVTESSISSEPVELDTKPSPSSDIDTDVASTPESFVTEKQDSVTDSPESGSTITQPSSPSIEQESDVTKSPEQLGSQEETTKSSEEPKETSQSKDEYTETTPYLVLLEEHTHKKEIYTMSPEEEITTGSSDMPSSYEPSTPEAAIEKITESVPISETERPLQGETLLTDKEQSGQVTETTTPEQIAEVTLKSEEITTTSPSPAPHITEDVQTTRKPEEVESNEISTATPTQEEDKKETDKPLTSADEDTDKEVPSATEKPHEATAPEDELILATTRPTSIKPEEELSTPALITDKFAEPEETAKPVAEPEKPKPDTTEEVPKPSFNEVQTTEEIPQSSNDGQFPPSGTSGYGQEPDYGEEDQAFGPGTCRYGGKVYVSAQQIPRDDPCDFCFCFRSDIICLQQSCPPPIHGCHEEPIQGFCCPRYECPVSMATTLNITTTTTTTTTTLPPHFLPHAYKGAAQRRGCQIKGHIYKVGEVVRASSGPCLHCTCGGDGQMKCDPKVCTPEPMLRQMIAAAVSAKRRR